MLAGATPAALLVHPPGASFEQPYLEALAALVPAERELQVVVGHVNPNRVALLHALARRWSKLRLIASNPAAQLLRDLWEQRRPAAPGSGTGSGSPVGTGSGTSATEIGRAHV